MQSFGLGDPVQVYRLVASMRENFAYLDPGSGSYLLQLLIAGILGALFVFRGYLGKVRAFFSRLLRGGDNPEGEDADTDEQ